MRTKAYFVVLYLQSDGPAEREVLQSMVDNKQANVASHEPFKISVYLPIDISINEATT